MPLRPVHRVAIAAGLLIAAVVTTWPAELKGRLELEARGSVGCPGRARIFTRFVVKPELEKE